MSLRDALLKAGKVSKKDAQSVSTETRKKRKKKGGHRLEQEAVAQSIAISEAAKEARDAENRAHVERQRLERKQQERAMQVRNLIQAWTRRSGRRANHVWHFVRSNGHVGRIMVDNEVAAELEFGTAGIIEMPDDPSSVRVLSRDGIRKLAGIYAEGVRFFVGEGGPSDPLVRPDARPERRRTAW